MAYFSKFFVSNYAKPFQIMKLEIKSSTRMKKFHCWVKYAVLNKTENEILKILNFATHCLMTIFNKCYNFLNDVINNLGRYDILKLYPFGIALCS